MLLYSEEVNELRLASEDIDDRRSKVSRLAQSGGVEKSATCSSPASATGEHVDDLGGMVAGDAPASSNGNTGNGSNMIDLRDGLSFDRKLGLRKAFIGRLAVMMRCSAGFSRIAGCT